MGASSSDLRLVPAAVSAWAAAFAGTAGAVTVDAPAGSAAPHGLVMGGIAALAIVVATGVMRPRDVGGRRLVALAAVMALVVAAGVYASALGRVAAQSSGPVTGLAADRAHVDIRVQVTGDPVPYTRRGGSPVWDDAAVRLTGHVRRVESTYDRRSPPVLTATPVVVLAPATWQELRIGDVVSLAGRLGLPRRPGPSAAVLRTSDEPTVVGRAATPYVLGDAPRAALRASVEGRPRASGGLLPSLVVGDESLLTADLREQLRLTGLAHLTAVSGANVAIVLGAVLFAARWVGVRGRGLTLAGLLAVGGFVLLARPEPSVVRAAAMGVVVVLGLASGRRRRGVAPLALAVTVLLLADPWLARSLGFALSVCATGALVTLARPWARSAARWLPRPVAGALAVPLAAQVACTPLLVVMSGEVSLSAVPANVLAAPAVAPATVLGVAAAMVGTVSPSLAQMIASVALVPTGWIVLVAEYAAALPGTTIGWGWGVPAAAAVAALICLLVPVVLRSAVATVLIAACAVLLLVRPGERWPPPDWVIVACDVGQGDALALRTAPGGAVVIDTGPDPGRVERCLDDLGIHEVALLVLTHFHVDHVGGVSGVSAGRTVREVLVTTLDEPEENLGLLRTWALEQDVPVRRARVGERGSAGAVTWQVIWPEPVTVGEGSAPNQASVVLRASVRGVTVLLTGDIEAAAQEAIVARHGSSLDVDVLKVPHHGSADQHPSLLASARPLVSLVTVGADNSHGHPDPALMSALERAGSLVARTDQDGDVAVRHGPDGLTVVRRGPR